MMHGEKHGPAGKAAQAGFEPVEAGCAEASAVCGRIKGVEQDECAGGSLAHALNEACGVDRVIGKGGAKRGPVVMVSHEQAIGRLERVERPTQCSVGGGLAVLGEIASHEDERRIVMMRVDVGDRGGKPRIRIEPIKRRPRRRQMGIGEVDDLQHGLWLPGRGTPGFGSGGRHPVRLRAALSSALSIASRMNR